MIKKKDIGLMDTCTSSNRNRNHHHQQGEESHQQDDLSSSMNESVGVDAGEDESIGVVAGEKAHPPHCESEIQQLSSLLSANLMNTSKLGATKRSGKSSHTHTKANTNTNTHTAKTESTKEEFNTSTSHHGELSALVSPQTMAMIQKAHARKEALAISRKQSSSCGKESEATAGTATATATESESEVDIDLGSSSEVETDGSPRRSRKASSSSSRKQKSRLNSKDSAPSNVTRSRRNRRDQGNHHEDRAKAQLASAIDNKQLRRLPSDWDTRIEVSSSNQADEDYKDSSNNKEEQQQSRVRKRDLVKARLKHAAEVGNHAIHGVHEAAHVAGTVASAALHREAKVGSTNSDEYGPALKPDSDTASLQGKNIFKDLE